MQTGVSSIDYIFSINLIYKPEKTLSMKKNHANINNVTDSPSLEPAFDKGLLPDALTTFDGNRIENAQDWNNLRRPELLKAFASAIYGNPLQSPSAIEFKILERNDNALDGKAIRIQGDITCKDLKLPNPFRMLVYLPKSAAAASPVFIGLNFQGNHTITDDPEILIPKWAEQKFPRGNRADRYDLDLILSSGYGIATIHNADIEPDRPDARQSGIRGALLPASPKDDEAATITAWAWGLSRGLDALLNLPEVDPARVIVWGHSRLGKTSLWSAANDLRFAAAISNDSGCCGASLTRHILKDGKSETLNDIIHNFPHWFIPGLKQYIEHEEKLPVDQHELLALIAPRPVYVASAEEDRWADPEGEFLAAREASPVFRLFGHHGIPENATMPHLKESVGQGVGYHIRPGKHTVTSFDWQAFIDFMNANLKSKPDTFN